MSKNKLIDYTEYLAEQVDLNIKYAVYSDPKGYGEIQYAEYLEEMDKNEAFKTLDGIKLAYIEAYLRKKKLEQINKDA